jgi:hypothetical protein
MKRFFTAAIFVISVSRVMSAADRQLLGMMMPDAKVLGGMNIVQVRNSPYGQYLLLQGPFNQPEFQKFVAATGFDPLRDVTEVVAATPGMPGDKSGLAAVRGTFNIAQIVAFVKLSGEKVDESQGVPMIMSPDGQVAIALVDSTLVIAGDPNSVIAALPRRSAPSTLDPVLMAKANSLSVTEDAWAVTTMNPGAVGLPAVPKQGGLDLTALQAIQQSSAGVKFGASVNVTAEVVADTAQNANTLADLVRLVVQLGTLNPQASEIAPVLQNLSVKTVGTAIQLSLAIPEELMEQMGPSHKAPAVRMRKVAIQVH